MVGWPSAALAAQGVTSPFLLRCYYALIAQTCDSAVRHPGLHAVRALGSSALKGFVKPAEMRPPVLHMILLARVMLLTQALCRCWLAAVPAAKAAASQLGDLLVWGGPPPLEVPAQVRDVG